MPRRGCAHLGTVARARELLGRFRLECAAQGL